jgi:EF hand domain-containing protein
MRLVKAIVIATSAFGLAAGSAFAAGERPNFRGLDSNHDGAVSKSEAAAYPQLAEKFDQADKNHDGKLNRAEYTAALGKSKAKHAAKQDRSPASGSTANPNPKGN